MSKRKWNRKNTAGLLAAALLLVGIAAVPGYAAEWNGRSVDDASLTLSLGADSEYQEDLSGAAWNVAVYRVASYASQGSCVAEEGFEDVTDAINASESLTAEEAEELALEAARIVGWTEGGQTEDLTEPDAWISMAQCQGRAEGLSSGIYLVISENALTEDHEYTFQPSLLTIPVQQEDGSWTEDVTAFLKPEQNPRYGSLRIRKSLDSFNGMLGEVTFVFQIEGVDENGQTVYSNVAATTHSGAGTQEAVVDRIPSGTLVTVTEVYSGASYELTSQPQQQAQITADQVAGVEFSNTYNDELTAGTGAVNQFEYDENDGWLWNRLESGSQGAE